MGCRCEEGRQRVRAAARAAIRGEWRGASHDLRRAANIARRDLPRSASQALRGALHRLGRGRHGKP